MRKQFEKETRYKYHEEDGASLWSYEGMAIGLESYLIAYNDWLEAKNKELIELVKLIRNESIERKYGWSVEITCKIQKSLTNT